MNALPRFEGAEPRSCAPVIVAIPASNEAERVETCLAALGRQRDRTGAPLPEGSFDVLLLANGCTDDTAARALALEAAAPFHLRVVEATLPSEQAHAGGARKAAMDLAADALQRCGIGTGVIATTDADSTVASTWLAETLAAMAEGADAVAGFVDPDPREFVALGPSFGRRGRAEDRYLGLVAEIFALCDPRPHDPWPNHRVASGASLAVTLTAYRALGGLPSLPLGEDAAFVRALERAGFRVRHSPDVVVTTSCRFDGRASGGAADTMRLRHADPDALCDEGMEAALPTLRRAALRGRLRRAHTAGVLAETAGSWAARVRLPPTDARSLAARCQNRPFAVFWETIEATAPALRLGPTLRPSDLAVETGRAKRIVTALRSGAVSRRAGPGGSAPASPDDALVSVARSRR